MMNARCGADSVGCGRLACPAQSEALHAPLRLPRGGAAGFYDERVASLVRTPRTVCPSGSRPSCATPVRGALSAASACLPSNLGSRRASQGRQRCAQSQRPVPAHAAAAGCAAVARTEEGPPGAPPAQTRSARVLMKRDPPGGGSPPRAFDTSAVRGCPAGTRGQGVRGGFPPGVAAAGGCRKRTGLLAVAGVFWGMDPAAEAPSADRKLHTHRAQREVQGGALRCLQPRCVIALARASPHTRAALASAARGRGGWEAQARNGARRAWKVQ